MEFEERLAKFSTEFQELLNTHSLAAVEEVIFTDKLGHKHVVENGPFHAQVRIYEKPKEHGTKRATKKAD